MQNPVFLMKALFVVFFHLISWRQKNLTKLEFAALQSTAPPHPQFYCAQSIVPLGCMTHTGAKVLENRRAVRFCAPSASKDESSLA